MAGMTTTYRIKCAIEHVMDKTVFIVEMSEWKSRIDDNGEPVIFSSLPGPLSGLASMASHVMTAGSGISNPNPGIDVIRNDPADSPDFINIDHYKVLEDFATSHYYQDALRIAGVDETEELSGYIQSHIFVVGPYKENNHHVPDIPKSIRDAKHKE
jgi:hypothetical protein